MIKRAVSVVVAGGVALGGLAGLVWTAGGAAAARDHESRPAATSSAPDDAGANGQGPRGHKPAGLGDAIHGDLIVRQPDGTFGPAVMDRGKVTAKSANGFTLVRPDGVTVNVVVGEGTKYRGVENLAGLQVDKPAMVVAKNGVAVLVGQPNPERKDERRAARQQDRQQNQQPPRA